MGRIDGVRMARYVRHEQRATYTQDKIGDHDEH